MRSSNCCRIANNKGYPSLLPTRTKDKDVHQQANNKELESITMTAIAPSQQRGDKQKSTISRRTTTTTTRPKCLFFLLVVWSCCCLHCWLVVDLVVIQQQQLLWGMKRKIAGGRTLGRWCRRLTTTVELSCPPLMVPVVQFHSSSRRPR